MSSNAEQLRAAARALDEIADRIDTDGPSVSGAETIKTATGHVVPTDIGDHSKLEPGLYLHLFHGRKIVDGQEEQLSDWGSSGPVIGPLKWAHTTYGCDIKLQFTSVEAHDHYFPRRVIGWTADIGNQGARVTEYEQDAHLNIADGLVEYNGVFYGDFSLAVIGDASSAAALLRSLVADIRAMEDRSEHGVRDAYFGPFEWETDADGAALVYWPNLRVLLEQARKAGF